MNEMESMGTDRKLEPQDLRYMNIPKNYWNASLTGWGYDKTIVSSVSNIIESLSEHLITVVLGNSLSGKTSLAVLHLMEAWKKNCSCYMISNNVMWECRDDLFDEGVTIFDRCRKVDVLAIDNIFVAGIKSEYYTNALRTIVRHRVDWRKPTILVFGLDTDEKLSKIIPVDIRAVVANNCKNGVYALRTEANTLTIR